MADTTNNDEDGKLALRIGSCIAWGMLILVLIFFEQIKMLGLGN